MKTNMLVSQIYKQKDYLFSESDKNFLSPASIK
jgi:hypothetical protein